ncbi:MAG: hypothetical protein IJP34_01650 [Clostridia bacterium]|nr:hypothetical protein [Clostridia bacterium]
MKIKETIMHYIGVYDGCEKRVIQRTIESHRSEFKNKDQAFLAVNECIIWLIKNKYIAMVNYNEMTDMQKRYFESDGGLIYSIIKRYNESEYLKEKYAQNCEGYGK